jgi:hypothetical protein
MKKIKNRVEDYTEYYFGGEEEYGNRTEKNAFSE